ncbi:hypothetical protein C1H46_012485 [Malus baccata]|uniref:DUF7806 domain-containing protein n=1 Tax=Malus baccata TaxID=106549 RepID=A0A540MSX7_MALBA|nr:hypothetical protein C1H46_012485 [Malus baccata]
MSTTEALYSKLYDKYSKIKTKKWSELEDIGKDQEGKFKHYVSVAEEYIQHLRNENERLCSEVGDLRSEVASIRHEILSPPKLNNVPSTRIVCWKRTGKIRDLRSRVTFPTKHLHKALEESSITYWAAETKALSLLPLLMATAQAAAAARACFMDPEAAAKCSITVSSRQTIHFSHHRSQLCSLSMNGCQGDSHLPLGTVETRSFPAVPSPSLALDRLSSAISELKSNPPPSSSGIIRLQVPIQQQIEAIDWLYAQDQFLPRCFFSGRCQTGHFSDLSVDYTNGNDQNQSKHKLVSVAGVGSAVFFQDVHPFSYRHWKSLKRFLSTECPLIRAYGAIRFDARANISSEWEAFGYFYFMVPQVEFDELEEGSMLATTIAWDNALSWNLGHAIDALTATMHQISSIVLKLRRQVPSTLMLRNNNIPCKTYWDLAVNRALQKIRSNSALIKVVLARSSRVITATDIDPIAWLACLQPQWCRTIERPGCAKPIGQVNCVFQVLVEYMVDLKFSTVSQAEEICISAVHQSSGNS